MKRTAFRMVMAGLAATVGLTGNAQADVLTLTLKNPGFETPDCAIGDCPKLGNQIWRSFLGWTVEGQGGVIDPYMDEKDGTAGVGDRTGYAPDRGQLGQTWDGSLTQVTTHTLAARTQYELSVGVGQHPELAFGGYSVELLAGATLLDSASAPVPAKGKFVRAMLEYESSLDSPIGELLTIRLSSSGYVNWNNVKLTATPLHSPIPAGLPLLGSALAGLGVLARRRKS